MTSPTVSYTDLPIRTCGCQVAPSSTAARRAPPAREVLINPLPATSPGPIWGTRGAQSTSLDRFTQSCQLQIGCREGLERHEPRRTGDRRQHETVEVVQNGAGEKRPKLPDIAV